MPRTAEGCCQIRSRDGREPRDPTVDAGKGCARRAARKHGLRAIPSQSEHPTEIFHFHQVLQTGTVREYPRKPNDFLI
jgi:hypothetical protein